MPAITPEWLVDFLLALPEPTIVLVDGDGVAMLRTLDGEHPSDVLHDLGPEEGSRWDLVGFLCFGNAYTEGGPVERVTMAFAANRTDAAIRAFTPSAIISNSPVGPMLDDTRDFLGEPR